VNQIHVDGVRVGELKVEAIEYVLSLPLACMTVNSGDRGTVRCFKPLAEMKFPISAIP